MTSLIVSFLCLAGSLLCIYFYREWQILCPFCPCCCLDMLIVITIGLGIWFYWCTWRFLEAQYKPGINPKRKRVNDRRRDIHLEQYNYFNTENTRCRDQIWKTVLSVYGIYSALYVFFKDGLRCEFSKLSPGWFLLLCCVTAFAATIFHVSFEILALNNQRKGRNLGIALGLINPIWMHQKNRKCPNNLGVQFSVIVFGILIWAPPLTTLILKTSQR